MPRFISTTGNSDIAIAVCDRCKMKRPHVDLSKDPNFPGLMVCSHGCKDEFDPYRLPARKTERIAIRFPRPDTNIAVNQGAILTGGYGNAQLSTNQNTQIPENNGNLDIINPDA